MPTSTPPRDRMLRLAAWALLTFVAALPLVFSRNLTELGRTLVALGPCCALVPSLVMNRPGREFSVWHAVGVIVVLLGLPLL